ncbi:MAG: putative 4-mercaptohistidine N1-methyltransferase, partial [Legionellales bacterium]|nr:putative 4-mercaptohistidine N1-methyltransferase [Legionellales bacterium]
RRIASYLTKTRTNFYRLHSFCSQRTNCQQTLSLAIFLFFMRALIQATFTTARNIPMNIYESDTTISQYLEFHYGDEYFGVPNYPSACVDNCLKFFNDHTSRRALDLGCSVGRATFEFAKHFAHVDGVDFSAQFIQHAITLQEEGCIRFTVKTEGDLVEHKEITLAALGYDSLKTRLHFTQGDACDLKPEYKDYNLIFCGNLIDRLYDPALFLKTIHQRLSPNGFLVLTSPYTWLEEFTEKDKWLGGRLQNGKNQTTLEGLKMCLTPRFTLQEVKDLPFVIRETQRKFQHCVAEMSVWQGTQ